MQDISSRQLLAVTRGQRRRYVGAIAGLALASLCLFAAPLLGKYAIDVVVDRDLEPGLDALAELVPRLPFLEPFTAYLLLSAILLLCATAVGGVFQYLRGRWAAEASEAIVRGFRESLYRRLHNLQASFFDHADTGDLVQRCSSDIETLRVFLSTDVVEIGRAVVLLLVVTPILFWLDARLAGVSLCLMPLLVIFAYVFFVRVKQAFQLTDEAEGRMTAVLQENLTGIRVVRAFARQQYEIDRFAERNRAFRDHNHRLMRLLGIYWGVSDLVAMLQIGLVLMVGAQSMLSGQLTVGTLFAFLTYVSMIIWPIRHLGRVLTNTGKAMVSLGRIEEILGEPEESREAAPQRSRADGEIRIEGVHFAYQADRPVLHDVNLHILAGETVAIVGAPGAGKSTLIRVLLRLYAYSEGQITFDGIDLCRLNRQWLRQQIGVVLQDPFLYSRSIEDNLRVGRPDAQFGEIEQACVDAAVHQAVSDFPQGFQTRVGERGVTLSGGQRQRLALARALLKDPPVLILDDSLSAVDSGTEVEILRSLEARKGRHTTIVIAHRLSSIRHADRIVVMDRGRIVQQGSHDQLIDQDGAYRQLHAIQQSLENGIDTDLAAGRAGG